jgi:hypothetical protein
VYVILRKLFAGTDDERWEPCAVLDIPNGTPFFPNEFFTQYARRLGVPRNELRAIGVGVISKDEYLDMLGEEYVRRQREAQAT